MNIKKNVTATETLAALPPMTDKKFESIVRQDEELANVEDDAEVDWRSEGMDAIEDRTALIIEVRRLKAVLASQRHQAIVAKVSKLDDAIAAVKALEDIAEVCGASEQVYRKDVLAILEGAK